MSVLYYFICSATFYLFASINALFTCQTQDDCRERDELCLICANVKNSQIPQCREIYKDVYYSHTPDNCDIIAYQRGCPKFNGCNNNGLCPRIYIANTYSPICACFPGYFGIKCDVKTNRNDAVLLTWHVDLKILHQFLVGIFVEKVFLIALKEGNSNAVTVNVDKINLLFYGENGFYEDHSVKYYDRTMGHGPTDWPEFRSIKIPIRFPYKPYAQDLDEFFVLNGNVIGYEGSLRATADYNGFLAADITIKMYVTYDSTETSLKCVAVIKLLNCGEHGHSPFPINRAGEHVIVRREVDYYEDGKFISKTKLMTSECAKDSKTTWKVWRMGLKYRMKHESLNEPVINIRRFGNESLDLLPHQLNPGRYKILCEVETMDVTTMNFAYCHVDLAQLQLKGKIEVSPGKSVYNTNKLTIKVVAVDPNLPRDKQDTLEYKWTCKNLNDSQDSLCSSSFDCSASICSILPNTLAQDSVYQFYSTVISKSVYDKCDSCEDVLTLDLDIQVTVQSASDPPKQVIEIECKINCDQNEIITHEPVIITVNSNNGAQEEYIWSISKNGESFQPIDENISETLIGTDTLSIKPNILEPGTKYTIVATVKGKPDVTATFTFETTAFTIVDPILPTNKPLEVNCTIKPDHGIKGFDLFNIECGNYSSYRFEFYDKSTEDAIDENIIFSGRMLGTSFNGKLTLRLTRDLVLIYVYNRHGMIAMANLSVTLEERAYTIEVKNEIMLDLRTFVELGELPRLLGYISIVPDVIGYNDLNDVKHIAKTLISAFGESPPVVVLADIKLFTSTLYNVLTSLNKLGSLDLLPARLLLITSIICQQARGLSDAIFDVSNLWQASSEVQVIVKSLLDCLIAAVVSRDKKYDNSNEEDVDIYLHDLIKRATYKVEHAIELLSMVLAYRQNPAQPPTSVSSSDKKITLWVMINDKALPIYHVLNRHNIPVRILPSLQKALEARMSKSELLSLQVAHIDFNIFWWCKSDVVSSLASVAIYTRAEGERLAHLEIRHLPILILYDWNLNLTETIVTGVAKKLDPALPPVILDLALRVHRIDPETRSIIHLKFLYPQTTSSLRVLVSESLRPDYDEVVRRSRLITEQFPEYEMEEYRERVKRTFLYVTILPDPDVAANTSVNYTFAVSTKACQLWVPGYWSGETCQITANTTADRVHCECSHFSIFAAAFPVPPQEVDPFGDAKLFLTVWVNPLVVSLVSAMLLLFLLLLLLLWLLDRRDKRRGQVIMIHDSFPGDPVPYMLAVYTGSRFCAGTTANVGFKIVGEGIKSRAHVFFSFKRKVLRRSSDDWFVIFAPEHLGRSLSLHVWHDNGGRSPSWFCDKIIVYDMLENEESVFILEQWVALDLRTLPELCSLSATRLDMKNFSRTFVNNCILSLREGHFIVSIVSRHPRSEITRAQRLSLLMACVMLAMLCSIMFYRPDGEGAEVDDDKYSFGDRELLVSIQSLVISVTVTFIIVFLFRISYKNEFRKRDSPFGLRLRKTSLEAVDDPYEGPTGLVDKDFEWKSPYLRALYGVANRKRGAYKNFVRIVSSAMRTRVLVPATLPAYPPRVKRRTLFYLLAWSACVTAILLSAYFVMLYGLKLGAVNSQKWLSSVAMAVSEEFLVTGPVRTIMIAALVSAAFRMLYDADVHRVRRDQVDEERRPPDDDDDDELLDRLLRWRALCMYAPLFERDALAMLRRYWIRHVWWKMADFAAALLFACVLTALVGRLWATHLLRNETLGETLCRSRHPRLGSLDFRDVDGTSVTQTYAEVTFVRAAYAYAWYNGASLKRDEDDYWDASAAGKPFGLSRFRQLRVVTRACADLVGTHGRCAPAWSDDDEDEERYGAGWSAPAWRDPAESAWSHAPHAGWPGRLDGAYRLTGGATGRVYPAGGYVAPIGPTRLRAEHALSELRAYHWLDRRTRAAFIELTDYNPNQDVYSQVTLGVEYLVSSYAAPAVAVTSVVGRPALGAWAALWLVALLFFALRIGHLVNRYGLARNLSTCGDALRFVVVALALACLALYAVHRFTSERFVRAFHASDREAFFDFDAFTRAFRLLWAGVFLLLCVAAALLVSLARLGKTVFAQYFCFVRSLPWIVWMALVIFLFFFAISLSRLLLNLEDLSLDVYQPRAVDSREEVEVYIVCAYFVLKTFIFFAICAMFVVKFLHFYSDTKKHWFISSYELNYATFLYERLFKKMIKGTNRSSKKFKQ